MYMTMKQYAKHLHCSYDTVYRMVRSGEIPAVELTSGLRKLRRIDAAAADKALAERKEMRTAVKKPIVRKPVDRRFDFLEALKELRA